MHVLADLPDLFALAFDLILKVEYGAVCLDHDRLDFIQQRFQPLPLLRERGVQSREASVLTLAEAFKLRERQTVEKLLVRLDLTAEEKAHGDNE